MTMYTELDFSLVRDSATQGGDAGFHNLRSMYTGPEAEEMAAEMAEALEMRWRCGGDRSNAFRRNSEVTHSPYTASDRKLRVSKNQNEVSVCNL